MKKAEFIERVAEKTETSKAAAARLVDAIFDASNGVIAEAVQAGKQVSLPGFGRFRSRQRQARKGRNPRTGKEIDIPARTVVAFVPGKGLKDKLSGKATRS
jgi:DNA-binding protein HU-beta